MPQTVQKARKELLWELSSAVRGRGSINLPILVEVYDPADGVDRGANSILVSVVAWDSERREVVYGGDYYKEGTWAGAVKPTRVEDLETDELAAIFEVLMGVLRGARTDGKVRSRLREWGWSGE